MKIIEQYYTDDNEGHHKFHVKKTDQIKEKKIFALFPLLVNKKFRWFKYTTIKQRLYFISRKEFDDGWSYKNYWTEYKKRWEIEEIIS